MSAKGGLQLTDPSQDFTQQDFGDRDLRHLECDTAALTHYLGADLDEFLPKSRE